MNENILNTVAGILVLAMSWTMYTVHENSKMLAIIQYQLHTTNVVMQDTYENIERVNRKASRYAYAPAPLDSNSSNF